MKRYLITLASLFFVLNTALGQSASIIIDKLIKTRIITAKERPLLEHELREKRNVSYRTAILGGLEYLSLKKTFHVDPHKTGISYVFRNTSGANNKMDSAGRSLRSLLNKINQTGLLSDRVYNYALRNIDSNKLFAEVQLYAQLAAMTYRLERLEPTKILPVAEQLRKAGLLTDTSFNHLRHDIEDYKIESTEQLTSYCEQIHQFDLSRYKGEPAVWLEHICRDIAAVLPNVSISYFSYSAKPDTSTLAGGLGKMKTSISFQCNGHTYRHRGQAMVLKNKNGEIMPDKLQVLDMLSMFNDVLADQRSPLRLVDIMAEPGESDDSLFQHFSLTLLNAEQQKILMEAPCTSYLIFSRPNFDNSVNSLMVDSVITEFRKAGLFSHLSDEQIEKSAENVEVQDLYKIDDLLSNFPAVIYQMNSLMLDTTNLYTDLIKNLGLISHGAFVPTSISQKRTKTSVTISYTSNSKRHSITLFLRNGWPKTGFSPLLNQVAIQNQLTGRFYNIAFGNAFIYLTPKQHAYIKAHQLLDLKSWNQ